MSPLLARLRRRGFTLVEVALVIVVAATMASIAWIAVGRGSEGAAATALRADADRYRLMQTAHREDHGRFAAVPSELAAWAFSPRVAALATAGSADGYVLAMRHPATSDICVVMAGTGEGAVRCGEPEGRPADVPAAVPLIDAVRSAATPGQIRIVATPTAVAPWGAGAGAAVGGVPADTTAFVVVADRQGRSATLPIARALEGVTLSWVPLPDGETAEGSEGAPIAVEPMLTLGATGAAADSTVGKLDIYLISGGGRLMAAGTMPTEGGGGALTPVLTLSKEWAAPNSTVIATGSESLVPAGIKSWRLELGTGSAVTGKTFPIKAQAVYRRAGEYTVRLTLTDMSNETVTVERTLVISTALPGVSAGLSTIAVTPTSPAVGEWATVTVTVRDVTGAPAAGRAVILSAPGAEIEQPTAATNALGVATGRVRSLASGERVVSATAAGVALAGSMSITVRAGVPSAAHSTLVAPDTIMGGSSSAATVTVRDADGQPVPGVQVDWTAPGMLVLTATAVTDEHGVATTMLVGQTAGTRSVRAAWGATILGERNVVVVAGEAAGLQRLTSPARIAGGTAFSPAVSVRIVDAAGNPVRLGGVVVTATVTSGQATLTGSTATTDSNGNVSFSALRAFGEPGAITLSFGAPGLAPMVLADLPLDNGIPTIGTLSCGTYSPNTGEEVTCTLPASEPEGQPLTWQWAPTGLVRTEGSTATYMMPTSGPIAVWATVTDPLGAGPTSASRTVTFQNQAPTVPTLSCSASSALPGSPITCSASGSVDPDGGTISYDWSGSSRTGAATGESTTYSRPTAGTVAVSVTARDGQGGTSPAATASLTWVDNPPSAPSLSCTPGAGTVPTNAPIDCTASGSIDPDGQAVSYRIEASRNGTYLSSNGGGDSWRVLPDQPGAYVIRAYVADATTGGWIGGTALAYTVVENQAPIVGEPVLSATTITSGESITMSASRVDPDGQIATRRWHIWRSLPASEFIYADDDAPNEITYTFATPGTYQVYAGATDNSGATGAGTRGDGWSPSVAITVLNRTPTFVSGSCSPLAAPRGTTVTCTSSWSDPDGGTLVYDFAAYDTGWNLVARAFGQASSSWTVSPGLVGTYYVTATAHDSQGSPWMPEVTIATLTVQAP